MSCFQQILKAQKGGNILFVGHGTVNRVILCNALGLDIAHLYNLQEDYGCLNIIDYFPDSKRVKLMNG